MRRTEKRKQATRERAPRKRASRKEREVVRLQRVLDRRVEKAREARKKLKAAKNA